MARNVKAYDRSSILPLNAVELRRLNEIGPEKWAQAQDEGLIYWSMLKGKPLEKNVLRERIRELRKLYERAKVEPAILKPMGLSLVDIELGLIKNIEWLKAGGEQYETKYGEAESSGGECALFLKRRDRLKYTSGRSKTAIRKRRR